MLLQKPIKNIKNEGRRLDVEEDSDTILTIKMRCGKGISNSLAVYYFTNPFLLSVVSDKDKLSSNATQYLVRVYAEKVFFCV